MFRVRREFSLVRLNDEGRYFIGEVNGAGQPHGNGVEFHPDGSVRTQLLVDSADAGNSGRWVNGELIGRANVLYENGNRYVGSLKNGWPDGVGVMSWGPGGHSEGEFVASQPCGLGAKWDADGTLQLCGRWRKVSAEGFDVQTGAVPLRVIPEGKYLGETAQQVRRDHPEYSLVQFEQEGGFFIGEVNSRGLPHGQGVRFHPDGSVEIALLVDSVDASNNGRWIDGDVHGRATMLMSDGDRYVGSFKHDQFDGLGVLSCENGPRLEGEWTAGKPSGMGAQWDKNGRLVKCGRWSKSVLAKKCAVPLRCLPEKMLLSEAAKSASLLYPDGGYYSGPINQSNQRHGVGQMFTAEGNLVDSGTWINDQLQPAAASASAQVAPADVSAGTAAALAVSSGSAAPPLFPAVHPASSACSSSSSAPVGGH